MIRTTALAAALATLAGWSVSAAASPIVLDFDQDATGQPILAGQFIDDEYADWGVSIFASGTNGLDHAITFDSANPTGNDSDLVTPGYHPTNDTAMGNLLILPKDIHDGNNDGYVDDPDDHAGRPAGWFAFLYDQSFHDASVTLFDVEENGGQLLLVNDLDLNAGTYDVVDSLNVPRLGDNSMQTLSISNTPGFEAMLITMAGSGAVDNVTVATPSQPIPEPATAALIACGVFLLLPRRRRRQWVQSRPAL